MIRIIIGMVGMLMVAGMVNAEEVPYPFPIPDDMSRWMGDPNRGPEPEAKYAKTRYSLPLGPVNLSKGHPIRDYGHFRMNKHVLSGVTRAKPGFVFTSTLYDSEKAFEHFTAHDWQDGKLLRYSLAKPPANQAKPREGWPVVVVLPGMGGLGKQDLKYRARRGSAGLLWASEYYRKHFPAYIIYMHPQKRPHEYIGSPNKPTEVKTTEVLDAYLDVIDHVIKQQGDVDMKRIYVTGHSMGGAATWQCLIKRPNFFAAAAPAAGSAPIDPKEVQTIMKGGTPIWMMMGNDDPWNGSAYYIRSFQEFDKAGAKNIRFWEIQDVGHSGAFISTVIVADWMYSQRRP